MQTSNLLLGLHQWSFKCIKMRYIKSANFRPVCVHCLRNNRGMHVNVCCVTTTEIHVLCWGVELCCCYGHDQGLMVASDWVILEPLKRVSCCFRLSCIITLLCAVFDLWNSWFGSYWNPDCLLHYETLQVYSCRSHCMDSDLSSRLRHWTSAGISCRVCILTLQLLIFVDIYWLFFQTWWFSFVIIFC